MAKEHSVMQFLDYKIEKIDYRMNREFDFKTESNINMEQTMGLEIQVVSDEMFVVKLEANIHGGVGVSAPFTLDVSILGSFRMENWQKTRESQNIAKYNAPAILLPYLRSTITNITSTANISPYILPTFNIYELFENGDNIKND